MTSGWKQIIAEAWKLTEQVGIQVVRTRATAVAVHGVNGVRKVLMLHYLISATCFLVAISFFSTLFLMATQLSHFGSISFDWQISTSLGIFLVFTTLLGITVREKTWTQAFQVEKIMDNIFHRPQQSAQLDSAAIAAMVEKIVESKLSQLKEQQKQ